MIHAGDYKQLASVIHQQRRCLSIQSLPSCFYKLPCVLRLHCVLQIYQTLMQLLSALRLMKWLEAGTGTRKRYLSQACLLTSHSHGHVDYTDRR